MSRSRWRPPPSSVETPTSTRCASGSPIQPRASSRSRGRAAPARRGWIAEALGLSDVTALDLPRLARVACADQPTLLVLDNFEQVLDAAPLVADLLSSVATFRVLTTSRAPLRLRGEREYGVGPLALEGGGDAMSPADLERSPAVRLFVARSRSRSSSRRRGSRC